MVLRRAVSYIILILLFASPVYAGGERILAFDEDGLNVLNEELRQLRDKTFQIKSSSSDTTPGYLDGGILDITVIGDVTDGEVAGWAIDATSLTSGSGVTTVGLDSGGTNPAIYCGSATPASAPFRVTGAGAVTATSGSIGGWTLGATTLTSTNITIDSGNELIKSNDFVSGDLGVGWQIDTNNAEFNNIIARGKIRTSVFEKDTISSIGGNFLVCDSDILATDMTALDASTLTITGDTTFAVNDILRIKDGTNDEWLLVTNVGSAPTYTITRDLDADYSANDNPVWTAGTAVVNYGASGEGIIFMTASEANAPYMSVFTHAGAPYTTLTTELRIGNLNGSYGLSADAYGIGIGDYDSDIYLKYDTTSNILEIANLQSPNYVADTSGYKLGSTGLELNDGTIAGEGLLETIMIYSMMFGGD